MSNRITGEIPVHRKPKVSLAMLIIQGLGGPKVVAERLMTDGQPVNIPALLRFFDEVTEFSSSGVLLDSTLVY